MCGVHDLFISAAGRLIFRTSSSTVSEASPAPMLLQWQKKFGLIVDVDFDEEHEGMPSCSLFFCLFFTDKGTFAFSLLIRVLLPFLS